MCVKREPQVTVSKTESVPGLLSGFTAVKPVSRQPLPRSRRRGLPSGWATEALGSHFERTTEGTGLKHRFLIKD